jgi:hypothetical protein
MSTKTLVVMSSSSRSAEWFLVPIRMIRSGISVKKLKEWLFKILELHHKDFAGFTCVGPAVEAAAYWYS